MYDKSCLSSESKIGHYLAILFSILLFLLSTQGSFLSTLRMKVVLGTYIHKVDKVDKVDKYRIKKQDLVENIKILLVIKANNLNSIVT